MRDGVTLYANIFRPAGEGRYPVLLTRLPYGKDLYPWSNLLNPVRAASHGYVVIAQDCRGRFASEGDFIPIVQEGPDGFDTVEWAAQLPYSDGNVGMFGGSYFGNTQWAAAGLRPPHLKAIAPFITWSDYADGGAFRGGALELGKLLYWNLLMAMDVAKRRMAAAGMAPADIGKYLFGVVAAMDRLSYGGYSELPLGALPSLQRLGLDGLLNMSLSAGPGAAAPALSVHHGEVEVPSLNIGGWYDIFVQGTVDNFIHMREKGRGLGKEAFLVLGPWAHMNHTGAVGEVDFGFTASASYMNLTEDLTALQLRWFDRWLKGVENGIDTEPPVRYFSMGENRWRTCEEWPPDADGPAAWNLQPGGGLGPQTPPADGGSSQYRYDPGDPTPTLGGHLLMPGKFGHGVKDQRPLSARTDVLTFASEALADPLRIAGRVTADLWAASSAPDTDFVVRLLDVHPDGFMQNICDGVIRARFRNSMSKPEWLTPGEPARFTIDLWSTAHLFQPGHRVAVQVASASFPRWDRNLNTATEIGAGDTWEVADQTVLHDAAHPSRILLPVVDD